MATMFLTWAARRRETEIRFIGERGSITWSGGILTLEREGHTESFDHTLDLDKASYAKWFAGLFYDFATALDARDSAPPMADIAQGAAGAPGFFPPGRLARPRGPPPFFLGR